MMNRNGRGLWQVSLPTFPCLDAECEVPGEVRHERIEPNAAGCGIVLALAGLALTLADRLPRREFLVRLPLARLPLARLPDGIPAQRGGFSFFFPLGSCLVASVVLSLILWLLRR